VIAASSMRTLKCRAISGAMARNIAQASSSLGSAILTT
jgi:hypothetical protein